MRTKLFFVILLCINKTFAQEGLQQLNIPGMEAGGLEFILDPHYNAQNKIEYYSLADLLKVYIDYNEDGSIAKNTVWMLDPSLAEWSKMVETISNYNNGRLESEVMRSYRRSYDNLGSYGEAITKKCTYDENLNTERVFMVVAEHGSSRAGTLIVDRYLNKNNQTDSIITYEIMSNSYSKRFPLGMHIPVCKQYFRYNNKKECERIDVYMRVDEYISMSLFAAMSFIFPKENYIGFTHETDSNPHSDISDLVVEIGDDDDEESEWADDEYTWMPYSIDIQNKANKISYTYSSEHYRNPCTFTIERDDKGRIIKQQIASAAKTILNSKIQYGATGNIQMVEKQINMNILSDIGNVKYSYSSDGSGNKKSVFSLKDDSSAKEQYLKAMDLETNYNNAGLLTGLSRKRYRDGRTLNDYDKYELKYNNRGQEIENLSYNCNDEAAPCQPNHKYISDYDGSGRQILDERYSWDEYDKKWKGIYKEETKFDDAGRIVFECNYDWISEYDRWEENKKQIKKFSASGKPILNESYYQLVGSRKDSMIYDSKDSLYARIYFKWKAESYYKVSSNDKWVPSEKEIYLDTDSLTGIEEYRWNEDRDVWLPKYCHTKQESDTLQIKKEYRWSDEAQTWALSSIDEKVNKAPECYRSSSYSWNKELNRIVENFRFVEKNIPDSVFVGDTINIRENYNFSEKSQQLYGVSKEHVQGSEYSKNGLIKTEFTWDEKHADWVCSERYTYTVNDSLYTEVLERYDSVSKQLVYDVQVLSSFDADKSFFITDVNEWSDREKQWKRAKRIESKVIDNQDEPIEMKLFLWNSAKNEWVIDARMDMQTRGESLYQKWNVTTNSWQNLFKEDSGWRFYYWDGATKKWVDIDSLYHSGNTKKYDKYKEEFSDFNKLFDIDLEPF